MAKKFLALLLASLMMLTLGLTACGDSSTGSDTLEAIAKEDLKIGFIYVGDAYDGGYSQAHEEGRLAMVEKLGLDEKTQTIVVENIPEDASCAEAARNLIDQGCNVIYANSFGHMQWIEQVANEYPGVYFGHATGFTRTENMTTYMGRIYEARYLAGIVAGLQTKANKIGYVAAMPIAEVVRGINAFTLGVQSVNPEATVEVYWLNTWYDGTLEKSAALELLNKGCDVMAQHCDSPAPQIAAEEKGVFAIGYNLSTSTVAPKAYLTAPLFHWGEYYSANVQSIIDGKWASEDFWQGLNSGVVSLDTLSDLCVDGVAEKVAAAEAAIKDGSLVIFSGEIYDNEGNLKVAAGQAMTDAELTSFDWFVKGVIGSVPKS